MPHAFFYAYRRGVLSTKNRISFLIVLRVSLAAAFFILPTFNDPAFCQPVPPLPMTIRAPLMAKSPEIDGVIREDEWSEAFRRIGMIPYQKELYVFRKVVWWIGADGRMIYAAARSELPPQGELLARIKPKKHDPFGLHVEDGVELWISPNYSAGEKTPYFQFVGNPLGAITDTMFDPTKSVPAQPWDGKWLFKNSCPDRWWESEIAIAVDELKIKGDLRSFGFRLIHNWKQPWQYSSTESAPGGFKQAKTISQFHIDQTAPRIRMVAAESEEQLRLEDNSIVFDLKKHDFTIVLIEPEK